MLLLAFATRTNPRLTVTKHYDPDTRQRRAPSGKANLVAARLPPPGTGRTVLRGLLNPQR